MALRTNKTKDRKNAELGKMSNYDSNIDKDCIHSFIYCSLCF